MATIKEIAQKAGVSIGTVDRVLHDRGMVNAQTKERVLETIKELNYQPNHAAQGLAIRKKKLKLAFLIPNTKYHPFFSEVKEAAKKKAKELKQFGVRVLFFEMTENPFDIQLTEDKIEENLRSVDGIVVPGSQTPELQLYLAVSKKHNLPVVFYNAYIPEEEYLAYVGCNYKNSGKLAAGLSALAGGEDARVCIYSEVLSYPKASEAESHNIPVGFLGVTSHDERLQGFRTEMQARYPDMKILDVRGISDNQIDNYLSAQEMLKTYPDVNIVYVINPADYKICEAISRADEKHQIRIITNDLTENQIKMMQNGMISATICQEPEMQGAQPLEILLRYLAFKEEPKTKMQYTNLSIHIVQNM